MTSELTKPTKIIRHTYSPIIADIDANILFLRFLYVFFEKSGHLASDFAPFCLFHVLRLISMLTALQKRCHFFFFSFLFSLL